MMWRSAPLAVSLLCSAAALTVSLNYSAHSNFTAIDRQNVQTTKSRPASAFSIRNLKVSKENEITHHSIYNIDRLFDSDYDYTTLPAINEKGCIVGTETPVDKKALLALFYSAILPNASTALTNEQKILTAAVPSHFTAEQTESVATALASFGYTAQAVPAAACLAACLAKRKPTKRRVGIIDFRGRPSLTIFDIDSKEEEVYGKKTQKPTLSFVSHTLLEDVKESAKEEEKAKTPAEETPANSEENKENEDPAATEHQKVKIHGDKDIRAMILATVKKTLQEKWGDVACLPYDTADERPWCNATPLVTAIHRTLGLADINYTHDREIKQYASGTDTVETSLIMVPFVLTALRKELAKLEISKATASFVLDKFKDSEISELYALSEFPNCLGLSEDVTFMTDEDVVSGAQILSGGNIDVSGVAELRAFTSPNSLLKPFTLELSERREAASRFSNLENEIAALTYIDESDREALRAHTTAPSTYDEAKRFLKDYRACAAKNKKRHTEALLLAQSREQFEKELVSAENAEEPLRTRIADALKAAQEWRDTAENPTSKEFDRRRIKLKTAINMANDAMRKETEELMKTLRAAQEAAEKQKKEQEQKEGEAGEEKTAEGAVPGDDIAKETAKEEGKEADKEEKNDQAEEQTTAESLQEEIKENLADEKNKETQIPAGTSQGSAEEPASRAEKMPRNDQKEDFFDSENLSTPNFQDDFPEDSKAFSDFFGKDFEALGKSLGDPNNVNEDDMKKFTEQFQKLLADMEKHVPATPPKAPAGRKARRKQKGGRAEETFIAEPSQEAPAESFRLEKPEKDIL